MGHPARGRRRFVSRFSRRLVAPVALIVILLPGVAGVAAGRRAPPQRATGADTASGALSREWKRARSPNFVAVGNASDAALGIVLAELEAFRWAFVQIFPSVRLSSPVPTMVVTFKDRDSYTKFQPRDAKGNREDAIAGYFTGAAHMNYLVMGAQGDGSDFARAVVFHELAHFILHCNVPDIPIWLDEGLAEYYSTLKVSGNQIVIGTVPVYRLRLLRDVRLLPLEKMLSTQATLRLLRNDRDRDRFYAQAWALVHYLMLGNQAKRQRQLGAYVRALQSGSSIEQAFASAFACTYDELERELRGYVDAYAFPAIAVPVPVSVVAGIGAAQRMAEIEAEALQADLLVLAGAHEDAEKRLSALLRREPALAPARLSLALLRLQQGRRDEAVDGLRLLVKDDSTSCAAHVYLAPALVGAGQFEEAVQVAERATVLNDQLPAAWSALSLAALVADRPSQADAAMSRLLQLDPDPDHLQHRAYDAFRLGKEAGAARDAEAFVRRAGPGHESSPYMAFLAALVHRRLGQGADADRVLEQVRPAVERGSWTEKVLDFFQGRLAGDRLLQQATDDFERTEAHTYVGFHDLFAGRHDQARSHFRWVKQQGAKNYVEYGMAVTELDRMEKTPGVTPTPRHSRVAR